MNQTMHTLYLRHGAAFDLANQARQMSTPERGVSEFAAFCELWPKVCALLDAPATLTGVRRKGGKYCKWQNGDAVPTVATLILVADLLQASMKEQSIRLSGGTVIREWSAAQ